MAARQSAVNDSGPVAPQSGQGKINAFYLLAKERQARIFRVNNGLAQQMNGSGLIGGTAAKQDAFRMIKYLAKCCRRGAWHVSRFHHARQGAMAVEFALVAPIFIAVLIAVLQTAIFLFAQQSLQNAATQAARLFLTGQAQGDSQATFKNLVCANYLPSIFSCGSLVVVVQSYSSFAAANTSAPALYNNGQPVTNFAYSPGTPGQIMVVQLVYPWSVVGGPLGFSLANLPGGAAEMMGVSAFRVEPY